MYWTSKYPDPLKTWLWTKTDTPASYQVHPKPGPNRGEWRSHDFRNGWNTNNFPQIIHLFIGFSIIFTIHFGENSPYFWSSTQMKFQHLPGGKLERSAHLDLFVPGFFPGSSMWKFHEVLRQTQGTPSLCETPTLLKKCRFLKRCKKGIWNSRILYQFFSFSRFEYICCKQPCMICIFFSCHCNRIEQSMSSRSRRYSNQD